MSAINQIARFAVRPPGILATLALALGAAMPAMADPVYLVGAQVYQAGASGANANGPYQYSTNSSTAHDSLTVTPSGGIGASSAISYLLVEGDNVFSFSESDPQGISFVGLNLFFGATAASYNPTYQVGAGIPGNLTVYTTAGGSAFGPPAAGTNVASYSNDGFSTNAASYGGASIFQLGNELISISQYSAASTPSGSFTVSVRQAEATPDPVTGAVPEPASVMLLGVGIAGLCGSRRKRRPV